MKVKIYKIFAVSTHWKPLETDGNLVSAVSTGFHFGFHEKQGISSPFPPFPIYSGVKRWKSLKEEV